jgi:hypothetical protein
MSLPRTRNSHRSLTIRYLLMIYIHNVALKTGSLARRNQERVPVLCGISCISYFKKSINLTDQVFQSVVTSLRTEPLMTSIRGRSKRFSLLQSVLGVHSAPIQEELAALSLGAKRWRLDAYHLHLIPRLRIHAAISPLHHRSPKQGA